MHIQKSFFDLVSILHLLKQQEGHRVSQRLLDQSRRQSSESLSRFDQHLQLPRYTNSAQLVLSNYVAL